MQDVCANCHAPTFIKDHFLAYDLVNLQYNEIRRQFLNWVKLYVKEGLIKPLKETFQRRRGKTSVTTGHQRWLVHHCFRT